MASSEERPSAVNEQRMILILITRRKSITDRTIQCKFVVYSAYNITSNYHITWSTGHVAGLVDIHSTHLDDRIAIMREHTPLRDRLLLLRFNVQREGKLHSIKKSKSHCIGFSSTSLPPSI